MPMYAVIFKATINRLDEVYSKTTSRMRELALNEYGCSEFVSATEGDQEISISYWNDQKDIIEWKRNSEHLAAQELGKSAWYKSYQVQIVEIIREYTGERE
jgi:heme-degrading monooxygenase HmoA